MINFTNVVRQESALFSAAVRRLDPDAPVATCPEWNAADLTWHLTEVQDFWGSIVEDLLDSPDAVTQPARPPANELANLFDDRSVRLVRALTRQDPSATCWSWYGQGHSVGWVRRRQAHEALIHRIDAELAVGTLSPIDAALAADGIDELLTVMVDASDIPDWASFDEDGRTAVLATDSGARWNMRLGRLTGTNPTTGTAYDDPALELASPVHQPTVRISGDPADINRWLWGRGSFESLVVSGDSESADYIRASVALATQ